MTHLSTCQHSLRPAAFLTFGITLLFSFTGQAASAAAAPAAEPPPADASTPDAAAASAAFGQSVVFRMDRVVVDPTHTTLGWLGQTTPAPYAATHSLTLRLALYPAEGADALVKDMGSVQIFGGNLSANPWPVSLNLQNVPDGNYRVVGELWDGAASLAKFAQPIVLVAGLDQKQADFTQRVAKIPGHDGAKAAILYPFDLARVINTGKRVYGSGNTNPEFGMTQDGVQRPFDFSAGLKKSAAVLAALEKGQDLMWGAKGETVQYYHMPEADEILPYHVFIPTTWDGKSPLPLVFILHGNSRDQDFYFERDDHIIPKAAEKHGYMLVAPLGYAPNAGYNYVPYGRGAAGPRGLAGAMAAAQNFGPLAAGRGARGAAPTGFGGVNGSTTPQLVRSEWSEQDAMHVFDLIKQEYPIDAKRTFLFGYSAGGQGAHYIGPKYADNWAAIAIGGSNATPGTNADPALNYPFARVKNIPYMLYYGANDPANKNPTHTMGDAMQQNGMDVRVKEYPNADHDQTPSAAISDILDFFDAHPRK